MWVSEKIPEVRLLTRISMLPSMTLFTGIQGDFPLYRAIPGMDANNQTSLDRTSVQFITFRNIILSSTFQKFSKNGG